MGRKTGLLLAIVLVLSATGSIYGAQTPIANGGWIELEIVGPNVVTEDSETGYRAIAHYDNTTRLGRDVTSLVEWLSWPETLCGIDENGMLSTEILNTTEAQVTVYAAYTERGIEIDAEKQVEIVSNCTVGSTLEFDGVDDYVEVPDTIKTYLQSNYTISAWVKIDMVSANNVIVAYRSIADGYRVLFQLDHLNTDARFIVRDGLGNIATAVFSNALTTGNWYHVVGVREGDTLGVYVNGVSGISDSNHFTTIVPDNLKIGAFQYGSNPPSNFLDGSIDEVAIYNRALSAAEIRQLYVGGNVDLGLVGRWNFEEGQGQVAHDSSGNGNHGRLGSRADVDNSDPNWIDGGVPRPCSVPQIMRRNIHGAIALKRDAMEDIHEALQKEIATLQMLYRLVRNKNYGLWTKINLLKARKHIFGAIIKEFHAKRQLHKSVEELRATLKALSGEIRPEDKPDERPDDGKPERPKPHERRGRGR